MSRRERRHASPPQRSLRRRVSRFGYRLTLALLVAGVALLALLRYVDPPVTAFMLHAPVEARSAGQPITIDHRWIDYAQFPDSLKLAVIAAEDQRFTQHAGLDTVEIRNALESARAGSGTRGASTLSQQTVKNLFLWPGQNWLRKGMEAGITVVAERLWPKRRILELYLNIAEFGPGIYGAEAAAQRYFGKPAAHLDAAESALLVAVLPNPRRLRVTEPSAYVRERQAWIQGQMPHVAQLSGMPELLR